MKQIGNLTRNQSFVFDTLRKAKTPMSAYAILDALRDEGFRAPLQVYRALEKLQEQKLVHRLESINAFVACCDPACQTHGAAAFAICDECGNVDEIARAPIEKSLQDWTDANHFEAQSTAIEIRGKCRDCH